MNKHKNKNSEEEIEKFSMEISLRAVRVATDKVNYQILKMLPTSCSQIKEKTKMSKGSVYRRVTELEKLKLIRWDKAVGNGTTGFICSTKLTDSLIIMINKFEARVKNSVLQQLEE